MPSRGSIFKPNIANSSILKHNQAYSNIFYPISGSSTLPAQYADSVDLKGGLLNNRVCTVKFKVEESYF